MFVVCLLVCLFQILKTYSGNTTTLDTRREKMDIEMKEDVAHEYEVTVSVECEAYDTPSIKP